MTEKLDVPATLRAIRGKLDLSQEQLAERLGVSFATVNRWEGGSNAPQKAARETIAALAREAGIGEEASSATDAPEVAAAEVTRRRRGKAAGAAPSTKPMEQMLWDAACSIRGEKDAAKFKDYLLPLLFLKRLSDVFDDEITRLAEEYGDRETALEIAEGDHSLLRFYVPPEARWAVLSGREAFNWPPKEKPKDIGEHLTKAVRAVVKHNPVLSGVIDVVDFAAERNGERDINPAKLREVVETFSDPRYRLGLADVQPDFLGRAYEYLLRKFAEGSGQSAGEFFTPTEVGFLIAHIMRPKPGEECHDFACGSAGLLIKLQLVARELDPTSKVPLKLTAQELQAESFAIAQMNAIIHDMQVELARGDTMINPKFRTADGQIRKNDIVVANPMWNQPFAPDVFDNDPFERFRSAGGVTTGKGDWAWIQHALACMSERGRAAVVLDTGAVTRGSGSKNEDKERNIRKWFVERDLIDGVILLPDNLFYNTNAAGVIVVLSKRKPAARKNTIVLVNASRYVKKGKPKNYIPDEMIRSLAGAFLKGEPVDGEVAVITKAQAAEADYNLSPTRWAADTADTSHRDLATLVAEIEQLDAEQRNNEGHSAKLKGKAIRELLTRGLRGEAQQETDFGFVPKSWRCEPLDRLAEIQTGVAKGRKFEDAEMVEVPYLRVANVQDGHLDLTEMKTIQIRRSEVERYRLQPGDVVLTEGGDFDKLGRGFIWRGELELCVHQNHVFAVRPDSSQLLPEFFAYLAQSAYGKAYFLQVAHKTTNLACINTTKLKAFPVVFPSLDEQRELVAILEVIDGKIDLHKRKLAVLEELFKSLLHKLMTGEIRVSDLNLSALPAKPSQESSV